MRRLDLIALFGAVILTTPNALWAQPAGLPVVGYLHPLGGPLPRDLAKFREGLNSTGFFEQRNVVIEFRNANGRSEQLATLATEFARMPASVVFTSGGVAPVIAAKNATSTIPIVFVHGSDPVKTGLVQSLSRPGGHITGVTFVTGEIQQKALELLREALPRATNVAVLANPRSTTGERRRDDIERAARALGMELRMVNAATPDEFSAAFANLKQQAVQAVLVVADPIFRNRHKSIVALADRFSIPLMSFGREFAEAGAFMSYGADPAVSFREAGIYVGRILKGEKPADLPVLQPTKFELLINMKSARALGIEISPKLLALADEVIE